MNEFTLIGVDICKHVFHLHAQDAKGREVSRRKSATVLKSGERRPVSHMSSILRCVSRSRRRLD
jgi:hypothetical protein